MEILVLILITAVVGLQVLIGRPLLRTLFRDVPLDFVFVCLVSLLALTLLQLAIGLDLGQLRIEVARILAGDRQVEFAEVLEDATGNRLKKHQVFRLDTDDDGFEEWLVFYQYDLGTGRNPVGGAVYDVDDCRPPNVQAYELVPIDRDYLSEQWVGPGLRDIDGDGQNELLIHGSIELAIFRWVDNAAPCQKAQEGQRGYDLVGSFRGTGGVRMEGTRVLVWDRVGFERSQIAIKSIYELQGGTYLQPDGKALLPPVENETGLDFLFGQPGRVTETYYPEKTVLAFYQAVGVDDAVVASLLTDDALIAYPPGQSSYGTVPPRDQLARVLVKTIRYELNVSQEQNLGPVEIDVCVASVRADGTVDPARVVRWTVRGVPREGALPYNCEWRLGRMEVLTLPQCPWPEGF